MAANRMTLYVVTGINKLSGEREAVCSPHGMTKTLELYEKFKARQHCRSAYKHLKIEPAAREGDLW